MASTITKDELKKICSFFSVKNFVADLPRMLNEAFTKVYNCITDFYDPDKNSITVQRGNIDYIVATTIVAQNLRVGDASTDYNSLMQRIESLENEFNSIQYITKQMIDDGIDTRPYYDPDASTN